MNARIYTLLGCLAAGLCTTALAAESFPSAGSEATIVLPPAGSLLKIYAPSNYVSGQPCPVIFFYHGMGGRPDTSFINKLTGRRDYIVVGMPYLEDDAQRRTRMEQKNYLRRELANLAAARAWLAAHASVDENRIFLAGISKGGWVVSSLGEMDLPRFGGLIILLAGRPAYASYRRPLEGLQQKPIYIGTGETDPNNIPARRAREYYRRNGALVTFEEYAGCGHSVPPDSALLKAWLEMHGRYGAGPVTPAERQALTVQFEAALQAARGETNALRAYDQLASLAEDPRVRLCAPQCLDDLRRQLAAARAVSPVKEEWVAETAFGDLLYREACLTSLDEMKDVLDRLQSLGRNYAQTRYGQLAAQFAGKMAEAYRQSVDATRQANASVRPATNQATSMQPSFPVSGSTRTVVPVQKGNKIIFRPPGEK